MQNLSSGGKSVAMPPTRYRYNPRSTTHGVFTGGNKHEKNRRFISQLLPRKRTGNAGVSHRREQDERIAGIFEKQAQCGRLFHSRRNAE